MCTLDLLQCIAQPVSRVDVLWGQRDNAGKMDVTLTMLPDTLLRDCKLQAMPDGCQLLRSPCLVPPSIHIPVRSHVEYGLYLLTHFTGQSRTGKMCE